MSVVMVLVGSPHGPTEFDGQYLEDFDFEAHGGRGEITTTPDLARAKRFRDVLDAIAYRNTVPKCRPLRPDGRPNRPLTATHWEVFDPEKRGMEDANPQSAG